MVTLDDNMKARLSKLTDSDGKIIVTDDMPDDLKGCINYLNNNNISLFSESDPSAYFDDYEPDPFAPGFVDSADSDASIDDDDDDEDVEEYDEDLDDDQNVADLDNIF